MKKIKILFLIIIAILLIQNTCLATDSDSIISSAKNFVQSDSGGSMPFDEDDVGDLSDTLYNILLPVGIAIAFIVSAILGIKLIAGSVEEQAKTKEMLMPFGIGCAVIFGAFTIWKIVVNILQSTGL